MKKRTSCSAACLAKLHELQQPTAAYLDSREYTDHFIVALLLLGLAPRQQTFRSLTTDMIRPPGADKRTPDQYVIDGEHGKTRMIYYVAVHPVLTSSMRFYLDRVLGTGYSWVAVPPNEWHRTAGLQSDDAQPHQALRRSSHHSWQVSDDCGHRPAQPRWCEWESIGGADGTHRSNAESVLHRGAHGRRSKSVPGRATRRCGSARGYDGLSSTTAGIVCCFLIFQASISSSSVVSRFCRLSCNAPSLYAYNAVQLSLHPAAPSEPARQCDQVTRRGFYCAAHADKLLGLQVKTSLLLGEPGDAGLGLFTTRDREPFTIVDEYLGETVVNDVFSTASFTVRCGHLKRSYH